MPPALPAERAERAAHDVFEYAVLRAVPRVGREEFLNVGVVVFCRAQGFLRCACHVSETRLLALGGPETDVPDLRARLAAVAEICRGGPGGGLIGGLPPAERFRWLTATRSTVLQASAVHPGRTADAGVTLARLAAELVG